MLDRVYCHHWVVSRGVSLLSRNSQRNETLLDLKFRPIAIFVGTLRYKHWMVNRRHYEKDVKRAIVKLLNIYIVQIRLGLVSERISSTCGR